MLLQFFEVTGGDVSGAENCQEIRVPLGVAKQVLLRNGARYRHIRSEGSSVTSVRYASIVHTHLDQQVVAAVQIGDQHIRPTIPPLGHFSTETVSEAQVSRFHKWGFFETLCGGAADDSVVGQNRDDVRAVVISTKAVV